MREFKNPKAIELLKEARKLEEFAEKELEKTGVLLDSIGDIFTETAGLRVLADEIEDGIEIDDEEER